MANGDILETLENRLGELLKAKKLSAKDRAQIETMQLFVTFLRDDHQKVVQMFPTYQAIKWGGGILVGANLIFLFNLLVANFP